MNLKNCCPNGSIYKNNIKRFWWTSAIVFIGSFFLTTFKFLTEVNKDYFKEFIREVPKDNIYNNINSRFFNIELYSVFLMIIGGLLCIMIFNYMNKKVSVVAIHSLPVKREGIYVSNILSALTLVFVPVILNMVIYLLAISFHAELLKGLNVSSVILKATFIASVGALYLMSLATFVTMFTNSILAIPFTVVLLILPEALNMIVGMNLSTLIYGYIYDRNFMSELKYNMFSINNLMSNMRFGENGKISEVVYLFLITAIVFFIIAMFVYKKRKSECAGETFAFDWVKYLFKYGFTFCAMLMGFVYAEQRIAFGYILFIYVLFALLGYFIAEVVVNKSFKVYRNVKGFVSVAIVSVLFIIGIKVDLFKIADRVPSVDNVEYINLDIYSYNSGELKSKDSIENIITLHKSILKESKGKRDDENILGNDWINIEYKLKNGKYVKRAYAISYKDFTKELKSVAEGKESKDNIYKLWVLGEDMNSVVIYGEAGDKSVVFSEESDIKNIIEAIKKDVNNLTYDDMKNGNVGGYIEFYKKDIKKDKKDDRIQLNRNKSFKELNKFLKSKGVYEKCTVTSKDVKSIRILNNVNNEEKVIEDKIVIDEVLGEITNEPSKGKYDVFVEFKNGDSRMYTVLDQVGDKITK